jgi:tryptophan-rich sensory protein
MAFKRIKRLKSMKIKMSDPTFGKCAIAPWQPPKEVFVLVWTVLYTFYIFTLYRSRKTSAFAPLLIGLAINLCWVPVFKFNSKLGLFIILLMIVVALDSIDKLKKESLILEARFIQVYLGWLVFAFTLNAYIALRCET